MEPKRRILYLITSDVSARFLTGQLRYLVEHGFDVHVGVKLSDPPARFDDGVTVHHLPFEREPHIRQDVRSLRATVRLVRALRPDIVNASTPKAGIVGMVGALLCRVPQRVYVVRGLRFETLTGLRRLVFRLLERFVTTCATDVIFNSRSLLRLAEEQLAVRRGRGVVLGAGSGNGIDAERYVDLPDKAIVRSRLGIPNDALVVGFVGRLTRDKGIVDLIDAWRSLDGDVTLLLVGDFETGDPVPPATRWLVEQSHRIVHVPWVDDTRFVYPAMDVLAFPSYREGLPNVPLEAQLCGIPLVAYAATGTVDVVPPTSRPALITVGDVDALRASIQRELGRRAEHRPDLESTRSWVAGTFRPAAVWSALLALYRP